MYTEKALQILSQYHWPGNVRELKNLVKRMVILRPGERIGSTDIHKIISAANLTETETKINVMTLAQAERQHIKQALIECRGIVGGRRGAARLLGIPRSTLQYRLKKLSLSPSQVVSHKHIKKVDLDI